MKRISRTIMLCLILTGIMIFSSACVDPPRAVHLPTVEEYDAPIEKPERTSLRLGVVPGPYGDMFMDVIQPPLSQKGYEVELVYYENYDLPNFALEHGELDLNMFQHYRYLNNFKLEYDLDLSAVTEIPTVSMGIFSLYHQDLADLGEGATIAIPSDSTNYSRALMVLESTGLISISSAVDKTKATIDDLEKNPLNLNLVAVEATHLVAVLGNYDAAVINGNYAISGGLSPADALFNEMLADYYMNVIAVRTEDLGEPFVTDIIDVIHSNEYKLMTTDPYGVYAGFQYPGELLIFSKERRERR